MRDGVGERGTTTTDNTVAKNREGEGKFHVSQEIWDATGEVGGGQPLFCGEGGKGVGAEC